MSGNHVIMRDRNQSSSYLPRVEEAQADVDFYVGVSENGEEIYAIFYGDEVVGLSCIVVGNDKARRLYESLGFKESSCNTYAEKFF